MSAASCLLYLRIALIVIGLAFIFGIYPLSIVWPSGWTWGQGHSHYLMMIIGRSSVVHGAIMALQAISDPGRTGSSTCRRACAVPNSDRSRNPDANGIVRSGRARRRGRLGSNGYGQRVTSTADLGVRGRRY
jgi:hypothetical protein